MLVELSLVLISFLSGRLVRNKTRKEVEQWKKLLLITPFVSASTVLAILLLQNPITDFLPVLAGFALGFIFKKPSSNFFAALGFFMTSTIDAATSFTASALFALYFLVKGSLSQGKVMRELVPPVLALLVFYALFFVSPSLNLVFSTLFCGAVVGGELALVIKSKS